MDITTLELTDTDYDTLRVSRNFGTAEGCNEDYHLVSINGIDIYLGINYAGSIDPAKPEHAKRFSEYSAKEMKGFQEYWGAWDAIAGRENHKKTTKPGWGLADLVVYGFTNNIEIGEPVLIKRALEVGYTPTANRIDTGDLVWIDAKQSIREWLSLPDSEPRIFTIAEAKRKEGVEVFTKTLDQLQPLATLIK